MAKVSTADGISQPRLLAIEPATICVAVLFARGGVFGPDAAFVAAGGQLSTCQTRRSPGLRSGRLAPRLYRPVDPRSLVEHGVARRRAPVDRAGDRRPALLVDCPHRSAVEKSPGVHVLDFVSFCRRCRSRWAGSYFSTASSACSTNGCRACRSSADRFSIFIPTGASSGCI